MDCRLNHRRVNERFDGRENYHRRNHQRGFRQLGENDKRGRRPRLAVGDRDRFEKRRKYPEPNDDADFRREARYLRTLKNVADELRIKVERQTSDAADYKIEKQRVADDRRAARGFAGEKIIRAHSETERQDSVGVDDDEKNLPVNADLLPVEKADDQQRKQKAKAEADDFGEQKPRTLRFQ